MHVGGCAVTMLVSIVVVGCGCHIIIIHLARMCTSQQHHIRHNTHHTSKKVCDGCPLGSDYRAGRGGAGWSEWREVGGGVGAVVRMNKV